MTSTTTAPPPVRRVGRLHPKRLSKMTAAIAALDLGAVHHTRLLLAQRYFLRPMLYAFGLLLFLAFDERNTQFIYFQF